mgnify:FL=1
MLRPPYGLAQEEIPITDGRGGFGFVYQAQESRLHREIAIKELIPALVGDDAMLKRFLAEARATMRQEEASLPFPTPTGP